MEMQTEAAIWYIVLSHLLWSNNSDRFAGYVSYHNIFDKQKHNVY